VSKLVTTEVAHPSSAVANLVLNADGTVDGPGVGNLVAVKHALFTGTQTDSVAAGSNLTVTNLSITHALADAGHALFITAYLGAAASSDTQGRVGLAVADGTTLIAIGDADGTRTRVGAGGIVDQAGGTEVVTMPSVSFVYLPGDTTSRTYTVRAINISASLSRTIYVNRSENDFNDGGRPRASSALVIQEVRV